MTTITNEAEIELEPVKPVGYGHEIGQSIPTTAAASATSVNGHHDHAQRGTGSGSSDDENMRAYADVDERSVAALAPMDKGKQAWQFLAAATFIETTVWGLPYTVGVLHAYWHTHMFPEDESTLTLAATLQTGLMFMSTALLGPLFTTFPRQRRLFQLVGLVVSSVSLIAAGYVTKASHLVATIGCLYPFAGALYLPCATLIYEWFAVRRGFATGILFAGTGVGGTVFPLIVQGLISRFGYKAAMVSLGLGFGVLNAIALFFIRRRVPLPARGVPHPQRAKVDWKIATTRPFWIGFFVILLTSLGNFNPTLWIPTFADTVGAKRPDGTALVAIMNAVSVPGNALTGWISDRVPARVTVSINCFLAALSILVLWGFGTSSGMLVAFAFLWGLSALCLVALWSKLITRTCKDDQTMSVLIFSMYAVLRGVGNLTSGPISTKLLKTGVLRGAAGAYGSTNFGAVLIYTAVTIFAGGIAGLFFPLD